MIESIKQKKQAIKRSKKPFEEKGYQKKEKIL
jgi:hypothetical protein